MEYRKVKDRAILDYPVVIASLDTVQYDLALGCTVKEKSSTREQLKIKFVEAFKQSIGKRQMVLTRDGLYQYHFKQKGPRTFVPSSHVERLAAEKEFELVMDKRWGLFVHRFEHLRDREASLYGYGLLLVRKAGDKRPIAKQNAQPPKPKAKGKGVLKFKRSEPHFNVVSEAKKEKPEEEDDLFEEVPVPILANDSRKLEGIVMLFSSLVSRRLWQDRLAMVVQKRPIDTAMLEVDMSSPFESNSSNTSGNSDDTTFSQESKSSTGTSADEVKLTTLIERRDFSSSLWQELWKLNYGDHPHRHHRRAGLHGKQVSYDAVNGFEYPIKSTTPIVETSSSTSPGSSPSPMRPCRPNNTSELEVYPERTDSMRVYQPANDSPRLSQLARKRTITFADPIDNSGSSLDPRNYSDAITRAAVPGQSLFIYDTATDEPVSAIIGTPGFSTSAIGTAVGTTSAIGTTSAVGTTSTAAGSPTATGTTSATTGTSRTFDATGTSSAIGTTSTGEEKSDNTTTNSTKGPHLRMTTKINRYYRQAGIFMMRENKSSSYKLSTPERSVVVATEPPLTLNEPSQAEIVTVSPRGPQP
ncbi:hypothetical protein TRVA0_048S01090 [Trichomonascus vanleenenianus]|uniref:uncharacterized protein n=1 Tax=Trichomonascus vanleenenianus TaxID=2268995 RepID=UPI003EC9997C